MQIIVYLTEQAAKAVRSGTPPVCIDGVLREAGGQLQPEHPDTASEHLSTSFVLSARDMKSAATLIEQLKQCSEVVSAYIQPSPHLPQNF